MIVFPMYSNVGATVSLEYCLARAPCSFLAIHDKINVRVFKVVLEWLSRHPSFS